MNVFERNRTDKHLQKVINLNFMQTQAMRMIYQVTLVVKYNKDLSLHYPYESYNCSFPFNMITFSIDSISLSSVDRISQSWQSYYVRLSSVDSMCVG